MDVRIRKVYRIETDDRETESGLRYRIIRCYDEDGINVGTVTIVLHRDAPH